MTDQNPRSSQRGSWQWFVVPAVVIGLLAAVLALSSDNDDPSDGLDDARVRADEAAGFASQPTATPTPGPLTATSVDIEDGLVRAGPISPDPFLSVDPKVVTSPGLHEFTITGRDWTAPPPIFVLACGPDVVSFELQTSTPESCDLSNLTPATPVDGEFEIIVSYSAPSGGFTIIASDAGATQGVVEFIHVG